MPHPTIMRITFSSDRVILIGASSSPARTIYQNVQTYIQLTRWSEVEASRIKVETSMEPWVNSTGLKWCTEERFQDHLDKESREDSWYGQTGPRVGKNIRFAPNRAETNALQSMLQKNQHPSESRQWIS